MKRILVCFSAVLLGVVSVFAAEPAAGSHAVTLPYCFDRVRERLASVLEQDERVMQAQERLRQAHSAFLPDVHLIGRKTVADNAGGTQENTETRIAATQSLFNGFRDRNLLSIANSEVRLQQLLRRSVMRDACASVVQAFYAVALPEVDLSNEKENIAIVSERLAELRQRIRLGKARDTELYGVQSTLSSLQADRANSLGQRTAALAQLALLIGEDVASFDLAEEPNDSMLPPSLDEALGQVHNRSDLAAARAAVAEEEIRIKVTKGAFLPILNITANYYGVRPAGISSSWDAGLALDLPVFQGGRDAALVREEASRLRAARIALEFQERQAAADVRSAHAGLTSAIDRFKFLKDASDQADAQYQSLLKEYRLGLVNNLDVLSGMSTLLTARSAYARAAVQVRQQRALLRVALEQL